MEGSKAISTLGLRHGDQVLYTGADSEAVRLNNRDYNVMREGEVYEISVREGMRGLWIMSPRPKLVRGAVLSLGIPFSEVQEEWE